MAQVKWIPAAQRFASFMQETAKNEAELNQQIYQTTKRINTEQFAANIQQALSKATSEKELLGITGTAYSEALARGYSAAIPMISQYSNVYGQKLGIEKKEEIGKALLESMDPNEKVFIGEQVYTVQQAKEKYSKLFPEDSEGTIAEILYKLPRPQIQTRIGMDENQKIIYTEGYQTPGGNFVSTATGKESIGRTAEGTLYLERGGEKGFQETEDRYLTPGEVAGYSQIMEVKRRDQLEQARLALYDKDNLGLSDLKSLRTIDYQERLGLFGAAYSQELAALETEYGDTGGDRKSEQAKEQAIAKLNRKYYGSDKATGNFIATDYESLKLLNPEFYAAYQGEIEQARKVNEFNEELYQAGLKGQNIKNYIRGRESYIQKLNPDELFLFENALDPQERYDHISQGLKPFGDVKKVKIPGPFQSPVNF